jgi:hypothetical protein
MACRNRHLEGMEDGQVTPRGYPNFDSNIKNLLFLVLLTDGQRDGIVTDGWTDRRTDRDINLGGAG